MDLPDTRFLECAICLQNLADPYCLKCQHTFCKRCLERLSRGAAKVNCPICRIPTDTATWKKDFQCQQFIDFLEGLKSRNSIGKIENVCYTCKNHVNIGQAYFCKDCVILHEQKENHSTCAVQMHVKDYFKQLSKKLTNYQEKLKEIDSCISQTTFNKVNCQKKFDDVKTSLEKRRDALLKAIAKAYKDNANEISVKEAACYERIDSELENLNCTRSKITSLIECIQRSLNEKSALIALKKYSNENLKTDVQLLRFKNIQFHDIYFESRDSDLIKLQNNISDKFGKCKVKFKEYHESILIENEARYYRECKLDVAYTVQELKSNVMDTIYDSLSNRLFVLTAVNGCVWLFRINSDFTKKKLLIRQTTDMSRTMTGSYLGLLSDGRVVVLQHRRSRFSTHLFVVSKEFSCSGNFPINFCKPEDLNCISSSPCNKFLYLYSNKQNSIYKFNVNSKSCKKCTISLPTVPNFIAVSGNLVNIVLYNLHFPTVFIVSFSNGSIVLSLNLKNTNISCFGLSFLTENIFVAAYGSYLQIVNIENNEVIKKLDPINYGRYAIQRLILSRCSSTSVYITAQQTSLRRATICKLSF